MKTNFKKLTAVISLCLVVAVVLCSCGSKTAINEKDFVTKAEAMNLLTDDSDVVAEQILSGKVAGKVDGETILWTAEFYVLDTEEHAKQMYENNKSKFESGTGTSSYVTMGNYSTFEKSSDGKYKYLCRVDSTLLYVDVDEEYKDEVKELIKEIGY